MNIEAICLAVAGSACVQLLKLIDLSKIPEDERPNFKDVTYYFQYIYFHSSQALWVMLISMRVSTSTECWPYR